jgi:hypothetical protein
MGINATTLNSEAAGEMLRVFLPDRRLRALADGRLKLPALEPRANRGRLAGG